MEKFKKGDYVALTKNLTTHVYTKRLMVYVNQFDTPVDTILTELYFRKGTILKVVSADIQIGRIILSPVNDESSIVEVEVTSVTAASPAARLLYGQNDR